MNPILTETQAYSIDEYVHLMHDTINEYLQGKVVLDNDNDWSILQIIRGIDSIFESKKNRMHWKEPLELFVGVEDIIENIHEYVGTRLAYTKATFDTSLAEESARSPIAFILRLSLKTDEVPIITLDTYDASEVLVNRDVIFNVVNIFPVGHESNPTKRTLVDCKVVSNKIE